MNNPVAAHVQAPSADSWEAFNMALWEESVGLQRVNAAAYHLTTVLVNGEVAYEGGAYTGAKAGEFCL